MVVSFGISAINHRAAQVFAVVRWGLLTRPIPLEENLAPECVTVQVRNHHAPPRIFLPARGPFGFLVRIQNFELAAAEQGPPRRSQLASAAAIIYHAGLLDAIHGLGLGLGGVNCEDVGPPQRLWPILDYGNLDGLAAVHLPDEEAHPVIEGRDVKRSQCTAHVIPLSSGGLFGVIGTGRILQRTPFLLDRAPVDPLGVEGARPPR
mmetsp:Transcript_35655/g.72957  ORF Transcript_35655/g.72957 Transcript_35655/m.72957 type:complete len:206 (+) Transcript_35655:1188-1805(+)